MPNSVKLILKTDKGTEWEIAKNLTMYQAKRLYRLCNRIINRKFYETYERYEEIIDAIDKIETGYYYEIYSISEDFVKKLELKGKKELKRD